MRHPVVLDLETKHSFRQYPDPKDLKISVVGLYDYGSNKLLSFFENELSRMYPLLENASYLIGFNINSFDLPVLQAYYPGSVTQFQTLDILDEIRKILGRRLSLNDIAAATLNKKKSGHGLQAIELFKEGKLEELSQYCLDDVTITREIFDYGLAHGEILYPDITGSRSIRVSWRQYKEDNSKNANVSLTLPF